MILTYFIVGFILWTCSLPLIATHTRKKTYNKGGDDFAMNAFMVLMGMVLWPITVLMGAVWFWDDIKEWRDKE